jgi:hypothetical protein
MAEDHPVAAPEAIMALIAKAIRGDQITMAWRFKPATPSEGVEVDTTWRVWKGIVNSPLENGAIIVTWDASSPKIAGPRRRYFPDCEEWPDNECDYALPTLRRSENRSARREPPQEADAGERQRQRPRETETAQQLSQQQESPRPRQRPRTDNAVTNPENAQTQLTPTVTDMWVMMQQNQRLFEAAIGTQAATQQQTDLGFSVSQVAAVIKRRTRPVIEGADLTINVPKSEPERLYRCLCPHLYVEPIVNGQSPTRQMEAGYVQDVGLLKLTFKQKYKVSDIASAMLDSIQELFVAWLRNIKVGDTTVSWDIGFRISELMLMQLATAKAGKEGVETAVKKLAECRRTTEHDYPAVLLCIEPKNTTAAPAKREERRHRQQ